MQLHSSHCCTKYYGKQTKTVIFFPAYWIAVLNVIEKNPPHKIRPPLMKWLLDWLFMKLKICFLKEQVDNGRIENFWLKIFYDFIFQLAAFCRGKHVYFHVCTKYPRMTVLAMRSPATSAKPTFRGKLGDPLK